MKRYENFIKVRIIELRRHSDNIEIEININNTNQQMQAKLQSQNQFLASMFSNKGRYKDYN